MIEVNRNTLIPGVKYYIHRVDNSNEKGGRYIGTFLKNTITNGGLISHFGDIIYLKKGIKIEWRITSNLKIREISPSFSNPSYTWKIYEYSIDNIIKQSNIRQKENAMMRFIDDQLFSQKKSLDNQSLSLISSEWF
jgi:hypothetical protein